ncbi:type II toxin-antitoxin system prevent-host-death family antitoxin [Psychrobacter sp. 28M-43]|nr:type II toxin-antitoxin system prevent-host-death family antitoxin [Psychrobacter sp. 28M-43]
MRVISFSEARKHLKSVLDTVNDDANATIVTRRDADDAVVMSLDYYNSLMETVYLLKSPANAAHLADSIAQYKAGKTVTRELIDTVEDSDKGDGSSDNNEHTDGDIESA